VRFEVGAVAFDFIERVFLAFQLVDFQNHLSEVDVLEDAED
jgi:hypothetical protein